MYSLGPVLRHGIRFNKISKLTISWQFVFNCVVDRIMSPKDVHVQISRIYEYLNLNGKKRFCQCDYIKGLKMGPDVSTRVLSFKRNREVGESEKGVMEAEVAVMLMDGGHKPRMWATFRKRKRPEPD